MASPRRRSSKSRLRSRTSQQHSLLGDKQGIHDAGRRRQGALVSASAHVRPAARRRRSPQPAVGDWIWKRFPARGLTSWMLALVGTVAACLILLCSDKAPVDSWDSRMSPTVWLALTSAVSGAFLAHSFAEGAAVYYWRAAGRPTTLQDLHAVYESSTGILEAATNLLSFKSKALGLGSTLMTFSVLRGPLMQRASSTANIYHATSGQIQVHMARELPQDYAAIFTGRTHSVSLLTKDFSDVAQAYNNRRDMVLFDTRCDNCTTEVEAFGFEVNCTESTRDFNLTIDPTQRNGMAKAMQGAYLFQVNITEETYPDDRLGSFLRYTTLFKETDQCDGQLQVQTCDLHAGIAKFPVLIEKDKIELRGSWKDDTFVERKYMIPYLLAPSGNILGGFTTIAGSIYGSNAFMRFAGAVGYDVSSKGLPATQYMTMNGTIPGCGDMWKNPMEDLIGMTRDIGFRASLKYAYSNTTDTQKVEYNSGTTTLVFMTDFNRMWIAMAVSIVGILSVLPVFYGWWELGRSVSLNPLEIANAFGTVGRGSHVMGGIDPNSSVDCIVKSVKDIGPVRYGAWEMEGGVRRLGFAGAGMVQPPGHGERFLY